MAEVASLLLSPLLQAFFEKVASREFVDFFRRRKLDEGLLKKLRIVLLSVNGVLEDAEAKEVKSPQVKTWLDELKDAVYEAEDILDEIDTEALRSKLDAQFQTSTASKVRKSITTSLNPFGKEIEPKIKEVLERLEYLVKQIDVIGLKQGVGEKSSQKRPTTSLVDESGIFGRIEDKEGIIESLLSDEVSGKGLCVITIVGMGGIGKTTLAQLVYDNKRVNEHFDLKAWVCVSNEFDVSEITRTILEGVGSSTDSDRGKNLDWLQVTLKEKIMGKKFLIVLDDVWSENYADWEALSNPFTYGAQGSKVIVTTRAQRVAVAMRSMETHCLKQLSEEDCWSLFAKHAFREGDSEAYPKLQAIGREIVKKCHGLPLAAKAIGSLLWSNLDANEWNKILNSEIWDLQNDIVIPALRLSYQYLPSHLKRCFAYCSIFPQDYVFKKEELILLWSAEGFLQQSKEKTLEQVGDDYFCDLVARSLLQHKSDYGRTCFVMHDLVNDLAIHVSGEFVFRMKGENYFEIKNKARHFSTFKKSFDDVKKFETLYKAKGMRTFLPINDSENQILAKELMFPLLQTFRRLRVVSLSNFENLTELPDSISKVKHLRYLDLSHTSIRKLPDFVCTLCNLQTLILSWCKYLTVLPREMHKLVNLRHLVFEGTPLKELPIGLGGLKSLQTLTEFIVSKHGGSSVGELGKLANLRGSLAISGLQNVVSAADALDAGLKNMQYLEMLQLEWDADSDIAESQSAVVLDSLQPHSNLKGLQIWHYSGRSFPDWVGQSSLTNITSISLWQCKYCCKLPPFGQLPSLERLFIYGLNEITKVGPEFYGSGSSSIQPFGALKYLHFRDMPEWENWISCFGAESEGQSFFNNLETLEIYYCPKLTGALPIHLPSLNALEIKHCPRLVASLPRAPGLRSLVLRKSNGVSLQELPAGLQSLNIDGYDALESLPEGITDSNGCLLSTLNELQISNCRKLELPTQFSYSSLRYLRLSDSCDSSTCIPLNFISKINDVTISGCRNLESLEQHEHDLVATSISIFYCPKFVSFPHGGLRAPNLTRFDLHKCRSLTSLPDNIHTLLPSLQDLRITGCPEIESFPEGGLPSTLIGIFIVNCDKLVSRRMGWGLQKLHSVVRLEIGGKLEDVKSFPEEGLLPNSLTRLSVSHFPNMESLDKKGLRHLTSLRYLTIVDCPKFKFLPEEGLPASLGSLSISSCPEFKFLPENGLPATLGSLEITGCPSLEKKLERKKGKEWRRIAHVPCVKINHRVI